MARITKSKTKLCRRERYDLFPRLGDLSQANKRTEKRSAPGEHPMFPRQTLYSIQFREKQKVKRLYGLLEKQFRKVYALASKKRGQTGLELLRLLERRLDNTLFRGGMAKTRDQARQLVNHGHVYVNGKRVSIPSYTVEIGDKIEIKEKILDLPWYEEIKKINEAYIAPAWLNKASVSVLEVTAIPERDYIDPSINEQFIVEFYSK